MREITNNLREELDERGGVVIMLLELRLFWLLSKISGEVDRYFRLPGTLIKVEGMSRRHY